MNKLSWSPQAQDDLAEIDAYYRPLDFSVAQRLLEQTVAAGRFLVEQPRAGQIIEHTVYRKWRVPRTPYSLIYRETATGVRIVRVEHAAQNLRRMI